MLARDWLGEPKPLGREAALTELAVRYLAAHGPAAPADLAFWSGLRVNDAKAAWSLIRDRLVEVESMGSPLWTLRSRVQPAKRELIRLLPAFDEYLMGWKDRRRIAPAEHWAAVNRGGGWVRPVLLFDGRVVATWRAVRNAKGLTVEVSPLAELGPAARRGAESEAEHLAAFLGTPAEARVYSKTMTERSSSPFAMTANESSTSSRRMRRDTISSS